MVGIERMANATRVSQQPGWLAGFIVADTRRFASFNTMRYIEEYVEAPLVRSVLYIAASSSSDVQHCNLRIRGASLSINDLTLASASVVAQPPLRDIEHQ